MKLSLPVISFTTVGAFLKTLAGACIGLTLLGLVAAYCTGRAQQHAREHATQQAEHDTLVARAHRVDSLVRDSLADANARHARDEQTIARFRLADSLAEDAVRRLSRALPVDTNNVRSLRAAVHQRDSVIVLQSAALALARPAIADQAVTVSEYRNAATLALTGLHMAQRADTLSQALGDDDATAAHRRGIVQGIKGTVTGLAVVAVVGAVLHLVGKF